MGKVFKVRNVISDRIEAMKVLLPEVDTNGEIAERFLREIRVVATLEHPNIASLRTAIRVGEHLVMIMEYVDGVSLEAKLGSGKLELSRALAYASQVLEALSYAHGRGVVHRDVKPSNVLLSARDTAKLTDFGIASRSGDAHLTASVAALGSLYYMSPEQVRGVPVDGRSDLYSFGITLYEMVTGCRPIKGDSQYSILNAHLQQRPTAPIKVAPHVPPQLSAVIEKSLEKAPEGRFQTADEFRSALLATASAGRTASALFVATAAAAAPASLAEVRRTEFDSNVLERARKSLATYIGPLAKVLVARAAERAHSIQDLYEILAAEISSPEDRNKFLRYVPF